MEQKIWFTMFLALMACDGSPPYLYKGIEQEPLIEMEVSYKPQGGYIKTPETAVKVTEAIGMEFYGKEVIERQRPLLVTKSGNVWIVRGSFSRKLDTEGGVMEIRISSESGAVLGMIHGE